MKQETIKIQVLNDTKLCVLPVLPDMETVVPVERISNITISLGLKGHETTPVMVQIENGYIVIPISASMPVGVYSVHMQGLINGQEWSDNRYEMFELVKYGEGIRYDNYYTKTVVVGLPDSYVEELRRELEQKIAEAEAAKEEAIEKAEEYKEKVLEIDDLARKEDVGESTVTILQAIEEGGSDDAKQAFNAMKRVKPYLYSIEYASLNYEQARAHMLNAQVIPSACTTIRHGAEIGRNFDWVINKQVEFLVRTKAHNGRYATIGFCGALPTMTEEVVEGGEFREEYRYLPFYMQDGMNSEGLVVTVHQLPDNATRSQSPEGNNPSYNERERISALMLVRYVLDNFKSADEAALYIRSFVRVMPAIVGGEQLDLQFAIADKVSTIYIAFEGTSVYLNRRTSDKDFVMTNFRLKNTTLVDGRYSIEQSGIEDYGQGVERANAALISLDNWSDKDMLTILHDSLSFTIAYIADCFTDFAGMENDGVRATIHDTAALRVISTKAAVKYDQELADGTLRESADLWQTVHSVVYDVEAKTMRFLTQEIDGDNEKIVVTEPFAAGGGGISPEQYEALAKQGDNQEATNSAILGKVEGIATDIKTLDADVLQGKRKLAAAITQKGVRTTYTESLSDMAINVSAIPQTTYTGDSNFDAMVMPSEYMWNVYKIAEDLIGNNPYPYANRFFVAEYYRGYDSLVLSGADAYLTCDGDYYEVMGEQCIHTRPDGTQEVLEGKDPNHIWHDTDNGKMNRYVVFFFQADTYTFNNTTAAICPRRVAISGNCASFIVTGENRLTDVWVLGTLGHFEGGTTGESWNPAQVIRNYRVHAGGNLIRSANINSLLLPELEELQSGCLLSAPSQNNMYQKCVVIPSVKKIISGQISVSSSYYYSSPIRCTIIANELEEWVANPCHANAKQSYLPKLRVIKSTTISSYNSVFFGEDGKNSFPSLEYVSGSDSSNVCRLVSANSNMHLDLPKIKSGIINIVAYPNASYGYACKKISIGCCGSRSENITITTVGASITSTCDDIEIGDYENINIGLEPRWYPLQNITISIWQYLTQENIVEHIIKRLGVNQEWLDNPIAANKLTLTLGSVNLAKLTEEEKQIAIDKGWTLA